MDQYLHSRLMKITSAGICGSASFGENSHLALIDCMLFREWSACDGCCNSTLVTTWQLQTLCCPYLFSSKGVELCHSSTGFILDDRAQETGPLFSAAYV